MKRPWMNSAHSHKAKIAFYLVQGKRLQYNSAAED
jgi:hypothetical protein